MAVENTTIKTVVVGSGSAGQIVPIPFAFASNDEIRVISTDANGLDADLVYGSQYTLSGASDPSGGTLTTVIAVQPTQKISIVMDPAITQLRSYNPNDNFPAKSHEGALDKLTRICQRLAERIGRTFQISESGTITSLTNRILGTDEQGKLKQLSYLAARTALDAAPVAHTHTWDAITEKPSTFQPSAHVHTWDVITEKPSTFQPSAHVHTWEGVTEKPATFPPSGHNHPATFSLFPPNSAGEYKAVGTLTVVSVPSAGATIAIGGVVFTFVNGDGIGLENREILVDSPTDTATVAASIRRAINRSHAQVDVVAVTYPSSPEQVQLFSVLPGVVGNTTTLASSSNAVSRGGATLVEGADSEGDPAAPADFVGQIIIACGGVAGSPHTPVTLDIQGGHAFMCVGINYGATRWKRL